MRLLREEERAGRLMGVNYGGETTLLHQIYADNTRINLTMTDGQFDRLTTILQGYEAMSGARLNMSKSLVMQLKPMCSPDWLQHKGCEIAGTGINFIYMGVSTSCLVNEQQITHSIIKKIRKKLSHWFNNLLSWPAKTLLLRHVLAATPLCQLLSIGINNIIIEEVERLCRQFLWVWADECSPKASVIAWEWIAQARHNGGLGWVPIYDRAHALLVKDVVKTIKGDQSKWTQLARSLILWTLRKGATPDAQDQRLDGLTQPEAKQLYLEGAAANEAGPPQTEEGSDCSAIRYEQGPKYKKKDMQMDTYLQAAKTEVVPNNERRLEMETSSLAASVAGSP
ncbi:hypothetical protein R1sor_001905 [Riccia sorocarpa]|uniref:Reverse transcriptase domain-containing protein n=1 Tax=Riccia sorocarpa TaxID=122646 RepID=A0ABD3GX97_9MARC